MAFVDFFNSLSLDLKVLVASALAALVLALLAGNKRSEKRYLLLFTVLLLASVVRLTFVTAR